MACSRQGHYMNCYTLERADPISLSAFSRLQPNLQLSPSVVALQPSNLGKPWAIRAGLPRHMFSWLQANCCNLICKLKICRSAIQQIESTSVENDKWAQKELKFLVTNCWQPLPTMSRRVVFHPFYFWVSSDSHCTSIAWFCVQKVFYTFFLDDPWLFMTHFVFKTGGSSHTQKVPHHTKLQRAPYKSH